ncbi:MAG TPA: FAD-binding protein [Euryarchaeota archaeon]|nr:FAD-binding protein [Euryarchaeota archaeon]
METEQGAVKRINGGMRPPGSTSQDGVSSSISPSQRTVRKTRPQRIGKRMRQILRELEKADPEDLDEDVLAVYRALDEAGIETLLLDSEIDVRRTDASEPPKLISDILFTEVPALIAKPKDHEQVRLCVRACRDKRVPLVVRGAASSAFGAALPPDAGLVLDLGELVGVKSIDAERSTAKVLAGTRWADLSMELKKKGLALFSSPSSFFSTVGGWISTGGHGINSFSAGGISSQVRRLRVVLPDGTERSLSSKDPDFDLFSGTEGQLGVITEVSIAIRKMPKHSRAMLLQTSDEARAFRLLDSILGSGSKISHVMFYDEHRSREINQITPIPGNPLHDAPAILILLEGDTPEDIEIPLPSDIGWTEAPVFMANLLWGNRYFPMRARKQGPGMLGSEQVIPLVNMPRLLARTRKLGRMFGLEIASEAHIMSDKEALVLSFFLTDQRKPFMYTIHSIISMLLTRLGIEYGGRPYAVGIWNQPFSSFVFPEEQMDRLREKKRELDPEDLFNPSRFLSARSKFIAPIRFLLRERITLFALGSLLAATEFFSRISRRIMTSTRKEGPTPLELSSLACARCGACVSVCPAYLVTGRELVTGRGKMLFARSVLKGEAIDKRESDEIFLCIKCHACEEVCQTRLPLLLAYEELEERLESAHGRPKELIGKFVAEVEASKEYERLLYEGIISPDAGMKGGETDAV